MLQEEMNPKTTSEQSGQLKGVRKPSSVAAAPAKHCHEEPRSFHFRRCFLLALTSALLWPWS